MEIKLGDLEIGNKVWRGGNSGFCYDDIVDVKAISYNYDKKTGEKYKVIHTSSQMFDSRNGSPLNPPTAYYIRSCEQ
jgi:hypothetical protein